MFLKYDYSDIFFRLEPNSNGDILHQIEIPVFSSPEEVHILIQVF